MKNVCVLVGINNDGDVFIDVFETFEKAEKERKILQEENEDTFYGVFPCEVR